MRQRYNLNTLITLYSLIAIVTNLMLNIAAPIQFGVLKGF